MSKIYDIINVSALRAYCSYVTYTNIICGHQLHAKWCKTSSSVQERRREGQMNGFTKLASWTCILGSIDNFVKVTDVSGTY